MHQTLNFNSGIRATDFHMLNFDIHIFKKILKSIFFFNNSGGGGGADPTSLDISEVPYDINDDTSKSLKEIIDELIYVAPSVTAFSANPSVVEKGTIINNLALSWTINKAITTQSIN